MRWIWIDRFEAFERGTRAEAIKNVSLAEDHLHDHFPDFPIMPASLMIEGMAQTAGILVGEARDFSEKVILAKITRASFSGIVQAGETIRYTAEVEHLDERQGRTRGTITVGDETIGTVDIVFSHIDQNMSGLDFPEENFVFTESFMALLRNFTEQSRARIAL